MNHTANATCFQNAQGNRVCMQPSQRCAESSWMGQSSQQGGPHDRSLVLTNEEYDLRCRAYLDTLTQDDWLQLVRYAAPCMNLYRNVPGAPCMCLSSEVEFIPSDFVVPPCFDEAYPAPFRRRSWFFRTEAPSSAPSPAVGSPTDAPCGASKATSDMPSSQPSSVSHIPTRTYRMLHPTGSRPEYPPLLHEQC